MTIHVKYNAEIVIDYEVPDDQNMVDTSRTIKKEVYDALDKALAPRGKVSSVIMRALHVTLQKKEEENAG